MMADATPSEPDWVIDWWEHQRAEGHDEPHTGWVYFVRVEPRGAVKIGFTRHNDIERRLVALQVGNPYKLRVVAVVRGSFYTESMLHALFGRNRLNGEWFKGTATGLSSLIHHIAGVK